MAGILVGSVIFGILSDKWGHGDGVRGRAQASGRPLAAPAGMEWIPTELRATVGTVNGYCYTLGQFVLAAAAFGLPRWRHLQLLVSLPFYLFFLYSGVARVNGRKEEGDKLDLEVGSGSRRIPTDPDGSHPFPPPGSHPDPSWIPTDPTDPPIPPGSPHSLRIPYPDPSGSPGILPGSHRLCRPWRGRQHRAAAPGAGGTLGTLVRTRGMRSISCGVALIWFSTSFAYYGLAMDLQHFGVDVYVTQLVFGAVDIPAKLLSALALGTLGRRVTQAGALGLAGICILVNACVPSERRLLRLGFAVVGKGSLAASFNCAYIFTGELFPTVISPSIHPRNPFRPTHPLPIHPTPSHPPNLFPSIHPPNPFHPQNPFHPPNPFPSFGGHFPGGFEAFSGILRHYPHFGAVFRGFGAAAGSKAAAETEKERKSRSGRFRAHPEARRRKRGGEELGAAAKPEHGRMRRPKQRVFPPDSGKGDSDFLIGN
ncbi:PREDICTED: solute carrier family 22 member 6-like [Tinamus guttatus]|uniref:solute carrier family 22 member 6-like n=1 Tax=Tinamus guttatus TaxID=94827 RepID=UPI00052F15CE|nr:PREDICTED: solute carrier family 22 member 6-like [Tinamus guttatus]